MIRNRNLRRRWFYRSLLWSCLGPFIYIMLARGDFQAAFFCGIFSGPPMALGLYTFIFHIGPATKRLSFLTSLFAQTAAIFLMLSFSFTCGIVAIDALQNQSTPLDAAVWGRALQFFTRNEAKIAYFITLGFIFSMLVFWQVSRKFGPGVLWNWITGYYHVPREETRIFMFLDIRGSTTLAEQMGHLKFSMMIQEFFYDMTTPIMESKGAVSHYIGDEAVLTWTLKEGLRDANCVRFFFRMRDEIARRSDIYLEKFGVLPEFKAGVHIGAVVACEVGYVKSEVVYLGDVLNTTARIQGLCDQLGAPLLISEELYAKLPILEALTAMDHGPQSLKGKAEALKVFAIAEAA